MREGERREARWERAGSIARLVAVLIGIAVCCYVFANLVEAGDERALGAVQSSGFREVKLGGADALACSAAESSRHFAATNPVGRRVEGTVCCGLTGIGKGCTLRWRH